MTRRDPEKPADQGAARWSVEDFLLEPPRDWRAWRWLFEGDHRFPIRSHRGPIGRLLVAFKRVLRPLVVTPQNDLWERQRVFNLLVLEALENTEARHRDLRAEVDALRETVHQLAESLQEALPQAVQDAVHHNDALFTRLDQKLDRYRRISEEQSRTLRAALRPATDGGDEGAKGRLSEALGELDYVELEMRHRGTSEEIADRIRSLVRRLESPLPGAVLDLGCGRGEALTILREAGHEVRGVDLSAAMVERCRALGHDAEVKDSLQALADAPSGSLGAVVSFHVVEHLEPAAIDELVRRSYAALAPGGALVLETPNPRSLVAASRFWLDPTHVRPVDPSWLHDSFERHGFESVECVQRSPFPTSDELSEIDLDGGDEQHWPQAVQQLADQVNRLRDEIDERLHGHQDFAIVGRKPVA